MHRRSWLRFAFSGLALAASRVLAADAIADADALLEPIRARHDVPALAVLALRGDRIVAQGAVGVRQAGAPERVTREDKFHLGSDTKAMTATLAAFFVEEGKLTWSATFGDLFASTIPDLRAEWKSVTLQQAFTHRAGLVPNPGALAMLRQRFTAEALPEQRLRIVRSALSDAPLHEPGTKFLYSNTGYILAGAVLEKLSGKSWEDLTEERLFQPLGITSGGFGTPSVSDKRVQPYGHRQNGRPVAADADNPAYYGPAGTAHMSMADWSKFIALHLRGDPANPNHAPRFLKTETFAWLHTPKAGETYAGGWGTGTRGWAKGTRTGDTGRVLTHSGSNTMWYCVAWLAPEIDFAVLIASNQGGDAAAKACDDAAGAMIRAFKSAGATERDATK